MPASASLSSSAVAREAQLKSGSDAEIKASVLKARGSGAARLSIPLSVGELWTARQRQMHPIHYAISYRASFKPELPDFFIRRFLIAQGVRKGVVLDPFGGRGTTALQANLCGFAGINNDLNPVACYMAAAKQNIPPIGTLLARSAALDLSRASRIDSRERERLAPFFHHRTLSEIVSLRDMIANNIRADNSKANPSPQDAALAVIGLAALSRLHGHSDGFFSAYSFPQISIMPAAQRRNNDRRGIKPEYRSIKERIARKLQADFSQELPRLYHRSSAANRYLWEDARNLSAIASGSVDLIITSPPFLDKVNYRADNWMRAWFLNVEQELNRSPLLITADLAEWGSFMRSVMQEMGRLLKPGCRAVLEVGEVQIKRAKEILNLEEILLQFLPLKLRRGWLIAEEILINQQQFTKLANCWQVSNNHKGTNTNRCLVLRRI